MDDEVDSPRIDGVRPLALFAGLFAGLFALALCAGLAAAALDQHRLADRRLEQLQIEAQRKGIEIKAVTLNGNLMGALTMLGLTDAEIGREAARPDVASTPSVLARLDAVGHAFGANGVFVVGR